MSVPASVWWLIPFAALVILPLAAWKFRPGFGALRRRGPSAGNNEIGASTIIIGFWIMAFAVLGLGGIACWSYGQPAVKTAQTFALAFGTEVLIAFAASGIGGLLGFIFGVPKTLDPASRVAVAAAATQAGTPATSQAALAANTNLERVSDWLTTLIIGATLVQSEKVIGWVGSLGDQVDGGLTSKTFVPLVVVYFFTLSFLGVYLITRLYLTWALEKTLALLTGAASPAPSIVTKLLPKGIANTPYPATAIQALGVSPLQWSISPALPAGLNLDAATGTISGQPAAAAPERSYTVTVTSSTTPPLSGSAELKLEVAAAP